MLVVSEEIIVAKKRAKESSPQASPDKDSDVERQAVILTMRGSGEWKEWLQRLGKHCRLKTAVLIEQALMEYAEKRGFTDVPPERTP